MERMWNWKAPEKRSTWRFLAKYNIRPRDFLFVITMLVIPIIHFCVFYIYVNLQSFVMAFQLPTGELSFLTMQTVLEDIFMGGEESTLLLSIGNTLLYFTKDLLFIPFHVLIAYFLYRKVAGHKAFQVILYLPSLVSGVAIASMFQCFIRPQGPLGELLKLMGVNPVPNFLGDSDYATWTILLYTMWLGWAGQMLILGGAMVRIPVEVLESARMDGIGTFREITQMVIPLLWPTLSTLLILQMTGVFGAGGPILLFTQGNFKTSTLAWWIFEKVKYSGSAAYNEVAAAGLVFTVIGVPIILGVRKAIESIRVAEY